MDKIKNMIGSDGFNVLLNGNITTLEHILIQDSNFLHDLTNLSLDLIQKIKVIAAQELLKHKFQTADQIKPWERIPTGCQNLDNILKGGIPINGIIEIYGCSGVGKTQLCLQLSLQIQISQEGSQGREVIYISTEDVFPSKRLNQLAKALNAQQNLNINFEDHIYLEHIGDSVQFQKCLKKRLPNFLALKNVGLIVIDSIAGLFRSDNENCDYVSRGQEFTVISDALNSLQDQYNLAVVVVNQMTDDLDTGISEPCLGLAWANNLTCRFCLSKYGNSPVRKFEVIFAPDLPSKHTNIIISPEGIINA